MLPPGRDPKCGVADKKLVCSVSMSADLVCQVFRQKWLLDAFKSSYNRYCYPFDTDTELLAKTFSIASVQMPFVSLMEPFAIIYLFIYVINCI